MKQYLCHVLDHEGHVNAREVIEGSHENEAFLRISLPMARGPLGSTIADPNGGASTSNFPGGANASAAVISFGRSLSTDPRIVARAPWMRSLRR